MINKIKIHFEESLERSKQYKTFQKTEKQQKCHMIHKSKATAHLDFGTTEAVDFDQFNCHKKNKWTDSNSLDEAKEQG
jgi:hypothetical protein